MSAKFEVFQSEKNKNFYFHLKTENSEIILQSEGYTTKNNCLKGVESVKKNSLYDKAYELTPTHFNLKSLDNGQVIASSQTYKSETARDVGINSVKQNASKAGVFDFTKNNKPLRSR